MNPDEMARQMQQVAPLYTPTKPGQAMNPPMLAGQAPPPGQQQPQTVGDQYAMFMQNGGSMTPRAPQPQSADEMMQFLFMRQKQQEADDQRLGQAQMERDRIANGR